jgi:vacuolar-type H+-ATPase subunit I/STV1
MALSDDMTRLAARVKEAEDRVTAAQGEAKGDLERDVATVRASAEAQTDKLRQDAEAGKGKLSVGWHDLQRSWNEHLAKIRDDVDAKRAEHDVERAQGRAERAEDDARFAVDFAYSAVVEAEYAMLDATLTRTETDELTQQSGNR